MAGIDTSFYPQANPNALTQGVNLRGAQLANAQAHQDLVKGQVQYLMQGASGLAAKPDLSMQDVTDFAHGALNEGIVGPDVFNTEMGQAQQTGGDPTKLRALLTQWALRAQDAGKQFDAVYGTPSIVDTGNSLQPVTASSLTGIHPMGGPIQKTLTPQDLASSAVVGVNGQNQPVTNTTYNRLTELGADPLTGQPNGTGGNALTGSTPPSAVSSGNPPPVPLAQATNGAVGITEAPAPGAAEAQKEVGASSGTQYANDLTQAANFQQSTLPLQKAIPALEALGTTGTGPGTEQLNQIGSFLQSMGVPGIDKDGIKNYDEAKKYLTQYVNMTGNVGTNDKLAASFAGNPSTEISNAAAVDVAKTALSLSRLQNAQVRAFADTGQPAAQYSQFAKDFNAKQDPRAYGLDLMKPEQRAELINSLKGDDRTKFASSLRMAMGLGLVTPPGAANGQ